MSNPDELPEFRRIVTGHHEQQRAVVSAVEAPPNVQALKHKWMHRTETLGYGILLSGEFWTVLDDEEIHLKEGDIVVQRGTNHAWSNRSDTTARMVFILLDGEFSF